MGGENGTLQFLIDNKKDFLLFLRSRYKLYHLSNVFFRDLHYGVMAYLDWKHHRPGYSGAEKLTGQVVRTLVSEGILKEIDRNAFLLNYPEFKKPPVKPAAPAKPAAAAQKPATAAKPAGTAPAKPVPPEDGKEEPKATEKPAGSSQNTQTPA